MNTAEGHGRNAISIRLKTSFTKSRVTSAAKTAAFDFSRLKRKSGFESRKKTGFETDKLKTMTLDEL